MPIIDYLLSQGVEVVIGGDGRSLALLRHQYPGLASEELPGYNVTYAGSYGFFGKIAVQMPKVVRTTRAEHATMNGLVAKYHFDGIISDNRYGVWHENVPSVAISHQLAPDLPGPLRLLRKVLFDFHLFFLRHFDQLWIPDASGEDNLSGELSHKYPLPGNARFLGVLSRLRCLAALDTLPGFPQVSPRQADIVAVLSGPEPQRSILEQEIVDQARNLGRTVWIIQGKTEERTYRQEGNLHFFSFFNASELATVLRRAKVILSRGGYTSLMDFAALGCKHMILVPTPGQTEQLYLAQRLADQGMAVYERQESFDLKRALTDVEKIEGFSFPAQQADLERVITPWLHSLKKKSPTDLED
jgi:UDP-N-acetylglucosamine transferase subunit ALG13